MEAQINDSLYLHLAIRKTFIGLKKGLKDKAHA